MVRTSANLDKRREITKDYEADEQLKNMYWLPPKEHFCEAS